MTRSDQGSGQVSRFDEMMFRFGPSFIGLYLFFTLWLLFVFGDRELYYDILKWWGFIPYHYQFVDMKTILLNIDCWRHGVDVFIRNICVNGGWYSYSPMLLWAAVLPVGPDDHTWLGILIGIGFLLSLSLLPASRSWTECWIRCLATVSTVTAYGIERAEFDLPIFLIAMAGLVLLLRGTRHRFVGYALLVLAAFLKYYPAVLMLLAARERFRSAAWIGAATIVAALAILLPTVNQTQQALGMRPVGSPFGDFFGARNLPLGITLIASGPLPLADDALFRIPLSRSGQITMILLLLFAAWTILRSLRTDSRRLALLPDSELTFLVAGCAVMVVCFFAVQNVPQRGIFLLMILPGLFAMIRGGEGRGRLNLIYGIVFLLWEGLFYGLVSEVIDRRPAWGAAHFFYWLARELVWWWVMARLASLVIAFLWRSPALAPVLSLVRIPRPA